MDPLQWYKKSNLKIRTVIWGWTGQKWKICTLYRDGNKDIKTYEGTIGIELLKVSNKDRYVFSFFSFDHIFFIFCAGVKREILCFWSPFLNYISYSFYNFTSRGVAIWIKLRVDGRHM